MNSPPPRKRAILGGYTAWGHNRYAWVMAKGNSGQVVYLALTAAAGVGFGLGVGKLLWGAGSTTSQPMPRRPLLLQPPPSPAPLDPVQAPPKAASPPASRNPAPAPLPGDPKTTAPTIVVEQPKSTGDSRGEARNYKTGYGYGLAYRFGASFIKTPGGEPGFEPYFEQGENDGRAARRPQIADPELLASWASQKDLPAVGEPGGPTQMVS